MNASQHKKSSRLPGVVFGALAASAVGLALAAGASSGSAQDRTSTTYGASRQYGAPRDSGLNSPGTGAQPTPGSGGTGMESTSLPPNIMAGWKIRVCSEKTKADQINFKFTPTGSKSSYGTGASGSSSGIGGTGASDSAIGATNTEQSTSWTRGEATEIKVPGELRNADKLHVEATPSQKDQKASVCLIYNDHVAKKLNFDEREVSTVKSSDNGECGC